MDWDLVMAFCNAFGVLLIGVALLIGSEALRLLAGWKVTEREQALARRLADVEALRRKQVSVAELHLKPEDFKS